MSGLSVRVDEDRSDNIEDGFPTSGSMTVSGQRMKYSIYVFRKGKHEKFTKDEGVVFTINGQTHGYLSKAFFNRKGVGLNYIADSILVILDCSEIEGRQRENLFMNSRDRLSTCPLRIEIEGEMEDLLRKHPGLNALKDKRRREEVESKISDQKPLVDVLKNVLKKSPTLSRLFVKGIKLSDPFHIESSSSSEDYVGCEFPSFFTLAKKHTRENPKIGHLGTRIRVEYKTDVANDYFDRSKDPGEFMLYLNGSESVDRDINLWNGYAYLNLTIEGFNVGEILQLRSEINDVSKAMPIVEEFFVKVEAPIEKKEGLTGSRKKPSTDRPGDNSKKQTGFAVPNIIEVSRDGRTGHSWDSLGFTSESAMIVKGTPEDGYDFFVNVDNVHVLAETKSVTAVDVHPLQAKYKFGLVLIGLSVIHDYSRNENSELEEESADIYKAVEKLAKAVSPVIIPMIDSLGTIDASDLVMSVGEETE